MHLTYVLVSLACLGVASFWFKYSALSLGPARSTFFYFLFGLAFSAIYFLFKGEDRQYELIDLLHPAATALFLFVSILFYNLSLETLPVSKAATIRNFSFIVTIILALMFAGEELKPRDYLGVLLACASIVLLGAERDV